MLPGIIISCVVVAAIIIAIAVNKSKKNSVAAKKKEFLSTNESYEMAIKFEELPTITSLDENKLVEVKDEAVIAKLDNAVSGALRAIANSKSGADYKDSVKAAGQLYECIIPKGAVLDNSKAMEGAVRGSFRNPGEGIKGNANWVKHDDSAAKNLAKVNKLNAVMNVASMVVGQYYMSEINGKLEEISKDIEKIADFQKNEFKSKVYSLVAEVKTSSSFQVEIVENDEVRNRELSHLKNLESKCADLLGQANISLQDISKKKKLGFSDYEKATEEAELWMQYQQILLQVMYKISDLTYALNLGAISKDYSYALYMPYSKQAQDSLDMMIEWHNEHVESLGIDLEENRRKRSGFEKFMMDIVSVVNKDWKYIKVSENVVSLIEHQQEGKVMQIPEKKEDLYQNDVRLIAKDGKLFYLPNVEKQENAISAIEA